MNKIRYLIAGLILLFAGGSPFLMGQPCVPVLSPSGPIALCPGDSVVLSVSLQGLDYIQWFKNGSPVMSGGNMPSLVVNTPGIYNCYCTNSICSTDSASQGIQVVFNSVSINTPSLSICPGDTDQLIAQGIGVTAWLWNSGETSSNLNLTQPGSVYVVGFGYNGCTDTAYASVSLASQPSISLVEDTVYFCTGDLAEFEGVGSGISAWEWSTGETSSNILVGQPGYYTLLGFNGSGCSDTVIGVAIFHPLPIVAIAGSTSICATSSTFLIVNGNFVSQFWNTGSVNDSLLVNSVGQYWVEVTDSNGCKARDTVMISIDTLPVVSIIDTIYFCPGTQVTITGPTGYVSSLWSDNSTQVDNVISTAGTYSVEVIDGNGCRGTSNDCYAINYPVPNPPVISLIGNTVLQSTPEFSYQWYQDGNLIPGATGQTFTTTTDGSYQVEVTTANGCVEMSPPIILDFQLTAEDIPQGISPNGDGLNDFLVIENIGAYPLNDIQIFNRWGSLVYQKSPYDDTFNGSTSNGDLPDGTYFYSLIPGNGNPEISGFFVINR
jgi:gliding motility-associated-like protein